MSPHRDVNPPLASAAPTLEYERGKTAFSGPLPELPAKPQARIGWFELSIALAVVILVVIGFCLMVIFRDTL